MEQEIKNEELAQPLGVLFDTINYYKVEDLDKFINELNHDQALYCIVQACQSAFKRNAYSITESELLSKAIRKMSTPNIQS